MAETKTGRLTSNRGMALLLVVAVIAVLSVVVISFNHRTRSSMEQAYFFQDSVRLQAMAESGIDIGLSNLYHERSGAEHDSLIESWATLENVDLAPLFDGGTLQVEVIDLSGNFPINSLVSAGAEGMNSGSSAGFRRMLVRLLASGEFAVEDETEAQIIVDSLTDWLDGDDVPLPLGAENSYYLARETPHMARNGPLEAIEEVLQIRGMTAEILYGNDEKKGLSEYINLYGSGRININTAPPAIFKALAPDISDNEMEIADDFRRDHDSAPLLAVPDWYRSIPGWPRDVVIEPSLIVTSSEYFRIKAAAQFRTHTMRMTADVGRTNEEMTIYYRSMQ